MCGYVLKSSQSIKFVKEFGRKQSACAQFFNDPNGRPYVAFDRVQSQLFSKLYQSGFNV